MNRYNLISGNMLKDDCGNWVKYKDIVGTTLFLIKGYYDYEDSEILSSTLNKLEAERILNKYKAIKHRYGYDNYYIEEIQIGVSKITNDD